MVSPQKDDLRHQAKKQAGSVTDYVDAVLDRYSRTTIVRVNLYYLKEAQARLRVEHVFDDLDRLIRERERNPIFDLETGYIFSVEQGEDRGYHIHAAFFFNGNEVRGDIYKAKQIGDLWGRITRGQGYFDSCNHNKEKKYGSRRGIGIILRSDRNIRPHVHYAMSYLVKDDQQLRMKPLRGKCLRKGWLRWNIRGDSHRGAVCRSLLIITTALAGHVECKRLVCMDAIDSSVAILRVKSMQVRKERTGNTE